MKLKFILQPIGLLLLSAFGIFTFQNCSPTQFGPPANQSLNSTSACVKDPVTNECPQAAANSSCQFNGSSVPAQGVITAYLGSTALDGESCKSEQRHCLNGTLTGSYSYPLCRLNAPASCLFNGVLIEHGRNVPAFQNSSSSSTSVCTSQLRQCTNGVLSGSYAFSSCTSTSNTLSCHFGGRTYAHAETATAYLNSNVPFGQICISQVRQCLNGVMSGFYPQTACTPGTALNCQFNGRTLTSGETVTAFQTSTVPYGNTCGSQIRTCRNGQLDGSYNYSSCEPGAPKTCLFAGQTIASGETIKASLATVVAYDKTCSYVDRKCVNGELSGDANYKNLGCTVEPQPITQPVAPQCSQSEVLSATQSYIKQVTAAESSVIENCKDGANPTYQTNDPNNSEESAVRFFNTCGNRYCQQALKAGYIEGRVVERNAGVVILECRRKDPPPELSSSCQQKFRSLPEPIVIKSATDAEVGTACIDSMNPTLADNLPTSASKSVRFNFTCGARWCRTMNFSSGRVVENNIGALQVNCYQDEIFNKLDAGTIVSTTGSTIDDVSILCRDSFNPLITDSYPSRSAISQIRFVNTCGNRFCIQKGLGQSGWVTEIQNNSATEGLRITTVMCRK